MLYFYIVNLYHINLNDDNTEVWNFTFLNKNWILNLKRNSDLNLTDLKSGGPKYVLCSK